LLLRARGRNCGDQTGRATKTFASIVVFGATARIVFADRFKTRVKIVCVQDCQRIIRRRGACYHRDRS
jgi:hypothetical protein